MRAGAPCYDWEAHIDSRQLSIVVVHVQVLAAQEEQDVQTVPGATDSSIGLGASQQAQSQADSLQVQKLTQQVWWPERPALHAQNQTLSDMQ